MKSSNIKLLVFAGLSALVLATGAVAGAATANCTVLSSSLYMGRSDYTTRGDVTRLQTFLAEQGYFTYTGPKGYFGQITFNSVTNFQRARGISAIGIVGPLTRAEIQRVSCGGTTNPLRINSLSPSSGIVGSSVTIYGSGFTNNNLVIFGNGAVGRISSSNGTSLTFNVPDIQNPQCYFSTPPCMTFAAGQQVVPGTYSVSISNSNGLSNTLSFTVVANPSVPHINYLSPSSGAVGTSVTIYGSGFSSANSITFGGSSIGSFSSNNGSSISFSVPEYISPYCAPGLYCTMMVRQVTPGNYDVVVSNVSGTSNSTNFTVTSGTSNSVSISGLDAPSQLKVGQSGTWAVHATDGSGSNGNLNYSVVWGDEAYFSYVAGASQSTINQTASFTHTYNTAGTYTPRFTVTNGSGSSANVSSSVNVTN